MYCEQSSHLLEAQIHTMEQDAVVYMPPKLVEDQDSVCSLHFAIPSIFGLAGFQAKLVKSLTCW